MPYPSHIARDALRRALRTHPDCQTILAGRLVGALKLGELQCALAALGLDPDAIAAEAVDSGVSPLPRHRDAIVAAIAGEEDTGPIAETMADPIADAVETELAAIRGLIGTGGFSALDDRLRELVIAANKPAVEILVPMPVDLAPGTNGPCQAVPVHVSRPTGKTATWHSLFGVKGDLGKRDTQLWDGTHPSTPKVNSRYLWPHPATATVLTQIARGRNVMMYGPAGTGKTEFAQQLAAVTGRPFVLISCDAGTDAATLVGMTVPDAGSGGVRWQDGQLTKAIRTPGAIVCLDEPSVARAGALMVLQNVLANRQMFIGETGERVSVASGVVFLATDNTNGTGGGSRRGYTDTNRLNAAFLDRFGVRVKVDYLPADREAGVIVGYTGCTVELARLLVGAASVTRAAADDQTLSHGIGLRRLLSWAELLMDGIGPEEAFAAAILNCAAEQDVETLREQCLLTYDKRTVAAALNPAAPLPSDPSVTNATPAGRAAASDFNVYRV